MLSSCASALLMVVRVLNGAWQVAEPSSLAALFGALLLSVSGTASVRWWLPLPAARTRLAILPTLYVPLLPSRHDASGSRLIHAHPRSHACNSKSKRSRGLLGPAVGRGSCEQPIRCWKVVNHTQHSDADPSRIQLTELARTFSPLPSFQRPASSLLHRHQLRSSSDAERLYCTSRPQFVFCTLHRAATIGWTHLIAVGIRCWWSAIWYL
ncbi:hypothetical protein C8Q74DRAFT_730765 [Fomes fomentarius]|nr:hypothetical protein C8Q74DRAFT_730765 [Fomes fomentarius]